MKKYFSHRVKMVFIIIELLVYWPKQGVAQIPLSQSQLEMQKEMLKNALGDSWKIVYYDLNQSPLSPAKDANYNGYKFVCELMEDGDISGRKLPLEHNAVSVRKVLLTHKQKITVTEVKVPQTPNSNKEVEGRNEITKSRPSFTIYMVPKSSVMNYEKVKREMPCKLQWHRVGDNICITSLGRTCQTDRQKKVGQTLYIFRGDIDPNVTDPNVTDPGISKLNKEKSKVKKLNVTVINITSILIGENNKFIFFFDLPEMSNYVILPIVNEFKIHN